MGKAAGLGSDQPVFLLALPLPRLGLLEAKWAHRGSGVEVGAPGSVVDVGTPGAVVATGVPCPPGTLVPAGFPLAAIAV